MQRNMAAPAGDRGSFGTGLGFVFAAAGSAVGLGNIWGFPTQVGRGGGAAFVLLYLLCVTLICAPILISELALGRRAHKDPVGAFRTIRPGTGWWVAGALGVLAGVGILSFYSVVAGWTIGYLWFTASGQLDGTPQEIAAFFERFISNPVLTIGLTFAVLGLTAAVIIGGVRSGIERVTKALMPALFVLLAILAVRAVTLPGAAQGLEYYLQPHAERLFDIGTLNAALGQAFFSLSLGMGAMITYGSYLRGNVSIAYAAAWVVVLDTLVALLAGFIIFPSGFSIPGFDPTTSGPGLIFTVLPRLFAELPGGHLFGALFFLLLSVAALTSTISLLEVPVAHLIDSHGWQRSRAVVVVTGVTAVLAIPSALSQGAVPALQQLPGLGMDFLTMMNIVWNNFALPIGGFLIALFVGWVWRADRALEELRAEGSAFPAAGLWTFLVRYVCPIAIFLVIVFTVRSVYGR
jgi:NSS family neurotransmitter:Na+ symporter